MSMLWRAGFGTPPGGLQEAEGGAIAQAKIVFKMASGVSCRGLVGGHRSGFTGTL